MDRRLPFFLPYSGLPESKSERPVTVLAGIFSRRPGVALPETDCCSLQQGISRHPGDEIRIFRDERVCLMKLDIGVYGEPAFRIDPSGSVSLITGEPILRSGNSQGKGRRQGDLEELHKAWDRSDWNVLRETQGVFSAVHYRPATRTVTLIADKLGLRCLYYWIGESYLIFASALRILESCPAVPKVMDVRAVTQVVSFGWPLGDKTPYQDIRMLRGGEIIQVSSSSPSFERYWSWDAIPVDHCPESELLRKSHQQFMHAVKRRLHGDRTVIATLSGGLDSRCVVAALRAHKVRVYTFNFSLPGTQDQVFGKEFAKRVGTIHQERSISIGNPAIHQTMAETWNASIGLQKLPAERPLVVWAGDGGSVGLGHVYMTREVVALLRERKVDAAIQRYLHEQGKAVLLRLLQPRARAALADALVAGLRDELSQYRCEDPGRDLYVFLMLNDQRRHFSEFLENIDLNRFENHLPFFDGDFLSTIMSVPLDYCLLHRFYTDWLSQFQPEVTSVPWQSYPGHVPCPLPVPPGLSYQWLDGDSPESRAVAKARLLRDSGEVLRGKIFPQPIINKKYLGLARRVYQFGLRDYSYVLQAALRYQRYWKICDGKSTLS